MKILILFAHPAFQKSHVNKYLLEGLDSAEGITFHDLYERYPEFDIDIRREQELLLEHDCIIFQHPMFWYSTPAILKEWQDLVLEHNWAYGRTGNALKDKFFFSSITTGGPRAAYQREGIHNKTITELLAPVIQTAKLCKMITLPPFVVHGTHALEQEELKVYKKDYLSLLEEIKEDKLDPLKANEFSCLNDYIKRGEE